MALAMDPRLAQARLEQIAAGPRRAGLVMSPQAQRQLTARRQVPGSRAPANATALAPWERPDFVAQRQEQQDNGFAGVMGTVFGNPLVKNVLKPLDLLDVPRRTVISGLQEALDAINGGDASWSDFTKQIGQSDFGFGDVVGETGNKWLDRAIGFVGDVALDPTTYLTAGTSKFLGSAGRAALVGEAAAKGLGDDVLKRIARVGEHGLSAAERETLDLGKAGLRFRLPGGIVDTRLAGTGRLSTGIGKGLGAVRGLATNTPIGTAARRMGGSRAKELRPFVERIATGQGDMGLRQAGIAYNALTNRAGAEGRFIGMHAPTASRTSRKLSGRGDLVRQVEKKGATLSGDAAQLREVLDSMFKGARAEGVTGLNYREGYFPHYQTDVLKSFLDNAPESGLVVDAPGMASGRLDPRVFKENAKVTINGKEIQFDAADIDDIEQKLWDAFPQLQGQKLIDDDPATVVPRALLDYSRDVGRAQMEMALESGGVIKRMGTMGQEVDKAATAARNDAAKGNIDKAVARLNTQYKDLTKELDKRLKLVATGGVSGAKASVANAQFQAQQIKDHIDVLDAIRVELLSKQGQLTASQARELAEAEARLSRAVTRQEELPGEIVSELGKVRRTHLLGYRGRMDQAAAEGEQLRAAEREGRVAQMNLPRAERRQQATIARQRELIEEGDTLPERLAGQSDEEWWNTWAEAQDARRASTPGAVEERALELGIEAGPENLMTREELGRLASKIGTPETRSARTAGRIEKVGAPYSRSLTPGDRRVVRGQLTMEQLSDPNVLSDDVIRLNDPADVQDFYNTQVAMQDRLRPYRMETPEEAAEAGPRATPKAAQENLRQRKQVETYIGNLEEQRRGEVRNIGRFKADEDFFEGRELRKRIEQLTERIDKPLPTGQEAKMAGAQARVRRLQEAYEETQRMTSGWQGQRQRAHAPQAQAEAFRELDEARKALAEVTARHDNALEKQRAFYRRKIAEAEQQWDALSKKRARRSGKMEAATEEVVDPYAGQRTDLAQRVSQREQALADAKKAPAEPYAGRRPPNVRGPRSQQYRDVDAARAAQQKLDDAERALIDAQRAQAALPPPPENLGGRRMATKTVTPEDPNKTLLGTLRTRLDRLQRTGRLDVDTRQVTKPGAEESLVPRNREKLAHNYKLDALEAETKRWIAEVEAIPKPQSYEKAAGVKWAPPSDPYRMRTERIRPPEGVEAQLTEAYDLRHRLKMDSPVAADRADAWQDEAKSLRALVDDMEGQAEAHLAYAEDMRDIERKARDAGMTDEELAPIIRERSQAELRERNINQALDDTRGEARKAEREFERARAESMPNQVQKLEDLDLQQLRKKAEHQADFLVRVAAGAEKGEPVTDAVKNKAALETLKAEAETVRRRQGYRGAALERRAPLEGTVTEVPDDIEAAVQRDWDAHVRGWEAQKAEADAIKKRNASALARQQEPVPKVGRRPSERRFKADRRRTYKQGVQRQVQEADTTADLALDFELEEYLTQISQDVMEARRAENKYRGQLRRGELPAEVTPEELAQEGEAVATQAAKEEAERLTQSARGMKGRGYQKPRQTVAEEDLATFDARQAIEQGGASAATIGTQLSRRRFGAEQDFIANLEELLGLRKGGAKVRGSGVLENPLGFISKRGSTRRAAWKRGEMTGAGVNAAKLRDLISKMTPEARERFRGYVRSHVMQDRRYLGELEERIARLENPAEVTDTWQNALFEDFKTFKEEGPMEARDLSLLSDPERYAREEAMIGEQRGVWKEAYAQARDEGSLLREHAEDLEAQLGQQDVGFQAQLEKLAGENWAARRENAALREQQGTEVAQLTGQKQAGAEARQQLKTFDEGARVTELSEEATAEGRARVAQLEANREAAGRIAAGIRERIKGMPEKFQAEMRPYTEALEALDAQGLDTISRLYDAEDIVGRAEKRLAATQGIKVPKRKGNKIDAVRQQATEFQNALNNPDIPDQVKSLLGAALKTAGDMDIVDSARLSAENVKKGIDNGSLPNVMKDALEDGYETFKSSVQGREDLAIDRQVRKAITNIEQQMAKEPTALGKAIDAYTQVFKSYATMTPGFHFRNAVAATFMNASDGVSFQNMGAGARIWNAYKKNPKGEWWKSLPPRYQDKAQDVIKAVYNSGAGGMFSSPEVGARAFGRGHKVRRALTDNKAVQGSRWFGEQTEGAVRAGMALDTLMGGGGRRGGSLAEATSRINRIHFNYNQASEWDQQMRRIIPFWTFMSRNIPLQVQQMWTNPRSYLHYQSFKRNFQEEGEGTEQALPQYMRQGGAFRFSPGMALMPDIGAEQLEKSIQQMGGAGILSQLTPALKVPLQLNTERNFFYDQPYRANEFQTLGAEMGPLAPLFQLLNKGEQLPSGEMAVERRYVDAARDLIPMLGMVNRLGGTTADREGREMQALLNFLGIPVKQLTPQVLEAERRRAEGQGKRDVAAEEARRRALANLAYTA